QKKGRELPGPTADFEDAPNPGAADTVHDHRPEEIIVRLGISTLIRFGRGEDRVVKRGVPRTVAWPGLFPSDQSPQVVNCFLQERHDFFSFSPVTAASLISLR